MSTFLLLVVLAPVMVALEVGGTEGSGGMDQGLLIVDDANSGLGLPRRGDAARKEHEKEAARDQVMAMAVKRRAHMVELEWTAQSIAGKPLAATGNREEPPPMESQSRSSSGAEMPKSKAKTVGGRAKEAGEGRQSTVQHKGSSGSTASQGKGAATTGRKSGEHPKDSIPAPVDNAKEGPADKPQTGRAVPDKPEVPHNPNKPAPGRQEPEAAKQPVQVHPKESATSGAAEADTAGLIKKIFFINMDQDTKRRAHMESELARHAAGIPVQRITGLAPSQMRDNAAFNRLMPNGCCADPENDDGASCHQKVDSEKRREFLLRSCACDFAHRMGYEEIASNHGDGYYLLLEDDVHFEPGWLKQAAQLVKMAPPDWDMLRLGYWGDRHTSHRLPGHMGWAEANRCLDGVCWPEFKGYYGAHAILLTPFKAQKLLTSQVVPAFGDYADRFTQHTKDFKSYVAFDNLVTARDDALGSSRSSGFDGSNVANSRLLMLAYFEP